MRVRLMDVAVLLEDLYKAKRHPEIGWGDYERTVEEYRRLLNASIVLPKEIVEGGLWASNMVSEVGKFSHPDGLSFDQFTKRVIGPKRKFNKVYNWIEDNAAAPDE